MTDQQFAYRVALGGAELEDFIITGRDIAEAAQRARASAERVWPGGAWWLQAISYVGLALGEGREPVAKPSPASWAVQLVESEQRAASSRLRGATRAEQLVGLLEDGGGEAHLDDLQGAFATSRANAQNIVRAGIDAGLVERVGSRTGRVRLVGVELPEVSAAFVPKELSRGEQLVWLLREMGGEAHVEEVAVGLGTSRTNAQNTIRSCVDAGIAERVGVKTGRVRLVKTALPTAAKPAEPATGSAEGSSTQQPPLSGLRLRVWTALGTLGGARTAAEVAAELGCRPREAGNALKLLVLEGRVVQDQSQSPPSYSPRGGASP